MRIHKCHRRPRGPPAAVADVSVHHEVMHAASAPLQISRLPAAIHFGRRTAAEVRRDLKAKGTDIGSIQNP